MDIPKLVKQKRLELKESQVEFAKRFGITHANISDIERGKRKSLSFEMIEFIIPNDPTIITTHCGHCCCLNINYDLLQRIQH